MQQKFNMRAVTTKHTQLYQFEIFDYFHEVKHFVSTRIGGYSQPPFHGLNLGFGVEDDTQAVLKNRMALAESIGTPLDWFVFPRQTHSVNIAKVDTSHCGLGTKDRESAIADTDALTTNEKNVLLIVQVADCVPILLLDSKNAAIAAIHAGWKGTIGEIAVNTINKMNQQYGTQAEDIIAAIGPSAGPCCYEVGDEVLDKVNKNKFDKVVKKRNESRILDLWEYNRISLIESGVKPENIEVSNLCTICNDDKFFSSRKGKGVTGRFVAGIMLQ